MNMQIELNAIGRVEHRGGGHLIVIDGEMRGGLDGLAGFSHLVVLWWAHGFADEAYRGITVLDSPYREGPEKIGVFATRSPVRPNPLMVSVAELGSIDVERGEIRLPSLDAEEGSPVVDLKPYHPAEDRVREAAVPRWCRSWPQWLEDSAAFDWEKVFNF
jgi:tRNA-Thr(GGU) m(6)t(6)A37 methyltransferase TsaA